MKINILMSCCMFLVSCSVLPLGSSSIITLKVSDLKFVDPSSKNSFKLVLGNDLYEKTDVPKGVKGIRQATSSFYQVTNNYGENIARAESSLSTNIDHMVKAIKVQFDKESGNLLIVEDTSDALPCRRYILFIPTQLSYEVFYLSPPIESGGEHYPPRIKLLSKSKVLINGKIHNVEKLLKSKSPFSIGG